MSARRRRRWDVVRSLGGNRALLRVAAAYALFILTEYAVWVAMLVFAYSRGGASTAGLIALAQLAPAAAVAPLAAAAADRRSPVRLLVGGYLVQAAGMAGTAAAIAADLPVPAYLAAVVAATAVTATRPAQSTLVPSLAASPDQLTAANVVLGWAEAVCIMAAGLLVGVLISTVGVASVFAVCAVLGLVAAALVGWIRVPSLAAAPGEPPGSGSAVLAGLRASARLTFGQPRLRLLVGLFGAQAVVVGALDVLFVVLAVDVLHRSQAWAGYLNSVYGAGAVLAGTAGTLLIGRRLGVPILASAFLLSGALAAQALGLYLGGGLGTAGTVAILVLTGAGRAVLDLASRTLLQRAVPVGDVGRVFGLVEGLVMAGIAAGSLLVPLLAHLGGSRLAVLGVAVAAPLAVLTGWRGVRGVDAGAHVPIVEIALLRSLPLFGELPPASIEQLARSLDPVELPAGAVLMRQGEPGDRYYAVAAGELDATQDGGFLRRVGRGEGVGEIALLRDTARTATVVAHSPATLYALDRDPFLAAVSGHAATRQRAHRIAEVRLATAPAPASPGDPGAAARRRSRQR